MDSEALQSEPTLPPGIPRVVGVEMRRVRLNPPIRFYDAGRLVSHDDAFELMVRTRTPMPIAAVTPVLFVGDVIVDDYEGVEPTLYRFLSFDINRLQRGARISIGWASAPQAKVPTPFVFDPGAFPVA